MALNTTNLQQAAIDEIKQHSRKDPISGAKLAELIGLPSRPGGKPGTDMRSIVHSLRCKGIAICASGRGYYWPSDNAELLAYVLEFQARIDKQQEALDGMKRGGDLKYEYLMADGKVVGKRLAVAV